MVRYLSTPRHFCIFGVKKLIGLLSNDTLYNKLMILLCGGYLAQWRHPADYGQQKLLILFIDLCLTGGKVGVMTLL